MTTSTTPLSASIGVEVCGYSSKDFVRTQAADECQQLLFQHGVVVYREAHVADADLVTFSRMLGEVVVAAVGGHPDYPEISPVTMDHPRARWPV
jgi:alpha-ketoglutarate-dependent taurine dioxygenase